MWQTTVNFLIYSIEIYSAFYLFCISLSRPNIVVKAVSCTENLVSMYFWEQESVGYSIMFCLKYMECLPRIWYYIMENFSVKFSMTILCQIMLMNCCAIYRVGMCVCECAWGIYVYVCVNMCVCVRTCVR